MTDDRPIKREQLTPPSDNNYIFIIERTQHAAFRSPCVHYASQLSHSNPNFDLMVMIFHFCFSMLCSAASRLNFGASTAGFYIPSDENSDRNRTVSSSNDKIRGEYPKTIDQSVLILKRMGLTWFKQLTKSKCMRAACRINRPLEDLRCQHISAYFFL